MNKTVNSEAEVLEEIPGSNDRSTAANDTNTCLRNTFSIELLTGSGVIDLLLKPEFQKKLDFLFESCTWATVFQSRTYLTAWYKVYNNKHLPVLVIAMENEQLVGVLPMVLLDTQTSSQTRKRNRITGAGHYDAEYQTWLAVPAYCEVFIKEALAELMKQFPGHPVTFRYLPSATPLHWLKNEKKWRRYGILQSYTRPLINLKAPDHAKLLQSRQYRNKLNRLKRLGEVQLERIYDLESFSNHLHELALFYDFRFCALFNKHHFRDDPAKKEFLRELFRARLLHVTLMRVNGKTFAAVVGVVGENWVYLSGFSCHSPFKARIYSPGLLHFSLLAKKLNEEQAQFFDLTPGYDSYKDKLANQYDEVHELVISSNMVYRLKRRIKKWMHIRLIAAGIRPMTFEVSLKKYLYQLQHLSITAVIKKLVGRFQKKAPQKCYLIPPEALQPAAPLILHVDNLNDLLQFRSDKRAGVTRWDFVADAMNRFENGERCITWMQNNQLLGCAWISYPEKSSADEKKTATDNYIEIKKIYCHAKGRSQLQTFINGVINNAVVESGNNYFLSADPVFCQAMKAIGSKEVL